MNTPIPTTSDSSNVKIMNLEQFDEAELQRQIDILQERIDRTKAVLEAKKISRLND
jgi:uncharacterized small protein (DUF1192 family)